MSRGELTGAHLKGIKDVRKAVQWVNENCIGPERTRQLAILQQKVVPQLNQLWDEVQQGKRDATKKLDRFKAKPTPEATQEVQRWLGVYDPHRLAQKLMEDGNKAGLAALACEIPLYCKEHKVDWHRQEAMIESLGKYEEKIWGDDEKAAHREAEQWELSAAHIDSNHRRFTEWLGKQEQHPMHFNQLAQLYSFDEQGLPSGLAQLETV